MAFKVSQSKIDTWRRCKKAYYEKYVNKLRRKRVSRPLRFGGIVHQMFDAHANGDDPFEVLDNIAVEDHVAFQSQAEEYGEIIEDIRTIMTEYFDHYKKDDMVFIRRGGKGAEHSFNIDLKNGIIFTGKIDGVGRTKKNKLRWLVEHKTFSRMPNEDHRWRNLQSVVYIRAMDLLGWKEVDGTCWDYIYSKSPARPYLLKSGKFSTKPVNSLPSRVRETIIEAGQNPKDYADLIDAVKKNRDSYFLRMYNPVKAKVVDQVFDDFVATALEVAEQHGKRQEKTIGRHCEWCDFEALCRAELLGMDVGYIRKKEYYKHEAPEIEVDHEV